MTKVFFDFAIRQKSFLLSSLVKFQTPEIIKYGAALLIIQCQDDDDEEDVTFINDFKEEWIDQNLNWFEGWNYPGTIQIMQARPLLIMETKDAMVF